MQSPVSSALLFLDSGLCIPPGHFRRNDDSSLNQRFPNNFTAKAQRSQRKQGLAWFSPFTILVNAMDKNIKS